VKTRTIYSLALSQLGYLVQILIGSLDCMRSFVVGQTEYLGFGFTTLDRKTLQNNLMILFFSFEANTMKSFQTLRWFYFCHILKNSLYFLPIQNDSFQVVYISQKFQLFFSLILPRFSLHFRRSFSPTYACIFTKDCWSSTLSTRPRADVSKCFRSRSAQFTLDLVRCYWRKMTSSTLFITLLTDLWKCFKENL